jgi:hypothetical protein
MKKVSWLVTTGLTILGLAVLEPSIAAAQDQAPRYTVAVFVNSSVRAIHELYLAPADRERWGPDQLTDGVLKAGEMIALQGLPCDDYKLRVVDKYGRFCIQPQIPMCGQQRVVIREDNPAGCWAVIEGPVATLVNDSSLKIHDIYVALSTSASWGDDRLGNQVLAPGARLELPDVGCTAHDIRLVVADGGECVIRDVDLCADTTGWHLQDHQLEGCLGSH